jgi:predicted nuclease of predicted toxin-antitoxin system
MRLLADSCLHGAVVKALRAGGHDLEDVRSWPADPGDEIVLRRAEIDRRVVVTSDRDFGELAVFGGKPHAGVLVVMPDMTAADQARACLMALSLHEAALANGALVLVNARGVRVRT